MRNNVVYIIYKATNSHNGKVYVGATTKDLDQRKNDHEQKGNTGYGHEFHKAIATFGPEAFRWEQIDNATTLNELSEKERAHIRDLCSKEQGYNGDCGGGFKKCVYQYSPEGNHIETYSSLQNAANAVNATIKDISAACLKKIKSCKGFYWGYTYVDSYVPETDLRTKSVFRYSFDGVKLAQYTSVAEASRNTGINKSCIAKCCRKLRKTAGGFTWKYE